MRYLLTLAFAASFAVIGCTDARYRDNPTDTSVTHPADDTAGRGGSSARGTGTSDDVHYDTNSDKTNVAPSGDMLHDNQDVGSQSQTPSAVDSNRERSGISGTKVDSDKSGNASTPKSTSDFKVHNSGASSGASKWNRSDDAGIKTFDDTNVTAPPRSAPATKDNSIDDKSSY